MPSAWDVETSSNETGAASSRASAASAWTAIPRYSRPASLGSSDAASPVGSPDHEVSSSLTTRSAAAPRTVASTIRW